MHQIVSIAFRPSDGLQGLLGALLKASADLHGEAGRARTKPEADALLRASADVAIIAVHIRPAGGR